MEFPYTPWQLHAARHCWPTSDIFPNWKGGWGWWKILCFWTLEKQLLESVVTEHCDLWLFSSVYSWPFQDTMKATDLPFSCWNTLHTPLGPSPPEPLVITVKVATLMPSAPRRAVHMITHYCLHMGRVARVPALKFYTRRGSEISQGKAQHLPSMQTEVAEASEAASKVGWEGRAWEDRWGRQSNRDWYGHIPYLEQFPLPRIRAASGDIKVLSSARDLSGATKACPLILQVYSTAPAIPAQGT